ncbi:MAG: hypothetical protein ABNH26_00920 [Celeribacter sp.]|jgi:glucan phosphoethanolaminetransferase (alkaline phosphatase superfamily)
MTGRLSALGAVLLYTSPLTAGLSGANIYWILPLAAVFCLSVVVLTSRRLPRGWIAAVLFIGGKIMTQILIVALLFGAGRGLAAALGIEGHIPGWLWLLPAGAGLALALLLTPQLKAQEKAAFEALFAPHPDEDDTDAERRDTGHSAPSAPPAPRSHDDTP